ncbi:MAG: Kelch repeat-containing protein, partial [Candidatus Acidiferrales bacterium]
MILGFRLPRVVSVLPLCAGLLAFAVPAFSQTPLFVATGSLNSARQEQNAVLLNNGKVLIEGGQEAYVGDEPELYDPVAGTFSLAGNMVTIRRFGTATLLKNGQVLITGGYDADNSNSPVLATAELYDPVAETFTATGSMTTPRNQHTATLLNNGMVLITGGRYYTSGLSGEMDLASAELYDPATGTFSSTGTMTVARFGATATLLNNGKVLIAGGASSSAAGNSNNSAEIYDPATGTFTATGNMTTARYEHTATLLKNGKVLIAGGVSLYYANGPGPELYDPATGTFAATGNMTDYYRSNFTTTLLNDGKVLIAGGYVSGLTDTAELY